MHIQTCMGDKFYIITAEWQYHLPQGQWACFDPWSPLHSYGCCSEKDLSTTGPHLFCTSLWNRTHVRLWAIKVHVVEVTYKAHCSLQKKRTGMVRDTYQFATSVLSQSFYEIVKNLKTYYETAHCSEFLFLPSFEMLNHLISHKLLSQDKFLIFQSLVCIFKIAEWTIPQKVPFQIPVGQGQHLFEDFGLPNNSFTYIIQQSSIEAYWCDPIDLKLLERLVKAVLENFIVSKGDWTDSSHTSEHGSFLFTKLHITIVRKGATWVTGTRQRL